MGRKGRGGGEVACRFSSGSGTTSVVVCSPEKDHTCNCGLSYAHAGRRPLCSMLAAVYSSHFDAAWKVASKHAGHDNLFWPVCPEKPACHKVCDYVECGGLLSARCKIAHPTSHILFPYKYGVVSSTRVHATQGRITNCCVQSVCASVRTQPHDLMEAVRYSTSTVQLPCNGTLVPCKANRRLSQSFVFP